MTTSPKSAVRRLATARLISITGGAAAYTALMDYIFRETDGSSAWLSATLLLTFGLAGVTSVLSGALGDRFDRKRVMIVSDLLGVAAFGAMALAHDPGLILVLATASALVETPFWSASAAAIPNLVEEKDLSWANGLIAVGRNMGIMVGPAIGGVLAATVGAQAVFVLNAVSFAFSALLVFTVSGRFSGERADSAEHRGLRAGFVFLARDRVLRTITLAWFALVLGAGSGMVADRPLAELFGAGSIGFGLIIACWGAGSVLGSLGGRFMTQRTEPWWLVIGTTIVAACGLAIGASPWFAPILALSVAWGTGDALTLVAEQGIRQRRTPDAVRSRVMAASDGIVHAGLAVGFALAGPVLELVGPQGVYAVGGVTAAIAAIILVAVLRPARRGPLTPEPLIEAEASRVAG